MLTLGISQGHVKPQLLLGVEHDRALGILWGKNG